MDRYTFGNLAGRGGTAYAYLFYPTAAAVGALIVSHQGHKESYDGDNVGDGGRTLENTQFWLAAGYHVLSIDMPVTASPGRQPNPLTLTVNGAATSMTSHGSFNVLDTATDNGTTSLAPFLEPVIRGINQALTDLPSYPVYMLGLSGGGWSTEFAAALDTRIRNRYCVFGSCPWEILPAVNNSDPNDWENYNQNPAYLRGGWHGVRYALGGDHGRRAISIWSDGDPDFNVTGHHTELDNFKTSVLGLLNGAGTYDIHYDTVALAHQYTDQTLNWILADIQAHP